MPDLELVDLLTRHAVNLPFDYRLTAERAYRPQIGWIRDLSVRGAWVELPEMLAAPSNLDIRLDVPAGEVLLAAQVAWACPEPHAQPRLHGLVFTRMTPDQRRRLRELLSRRRSHAVGRLYCSLAATCKSKATAGPAFPCETRDLSSNGVALRLPRPVSPGTKVQVKVPTAFGTVIADAEVVWAESPDGRPLGAPYRHGLRFLSVNPSSELPLKLFLAGWR